MTEEQHDLISRRLSDRIISAFDLAASQGNLDAAGKLYQALEIVLSHQGGAGHSDRREDVENIRIVGNRYMDMKRAKHAA